MKNTVLMAVRALLVGLALLVGPVPGAAEDRVVRIAFVDTGNTGRSVTAEALADAMIAANHWPVQVISRAVDLNPYNVAPEPNAAALLQQRGLDVSGHHAFQVTVNDIRHSDLVLVMTAKHKATVLAMFPEAAGKVFTLAEYATGDNRDVVDAYGQPMPVYQETFRQIDGYVGAALAKAVQ
jgi:protein-tyrosine phosphatase